MQIGVAWTQGYLNGPWVFFLNFLYKKTIKIWPPKNNGYRTAGLPWSSMPGYPRGYPNFDSQIRTKSHISDKIFQHIRKFCPSFKTRTNYNIRDFQLKFMRCEAIWTMCWQPDLSTKNPISRTLSVHGTHSRIFWSWYSTIPSCETWDRKPLKCTHYTQYTHTPNARNEKYRTWPSAGHIMIYSAESSGIRAGLQADSKRPWSPLELCLESWSLWTPSVRGLCSEVGVFKSSVCRTTRIPIYEDSELIRRCGFCSVRFWQCLCGSVLSWCLVPTTVNYSPPRPYYSKLQSASSLLQ